MNPERRLTSLTAFYFGRRVASAPHSDEAIRSVCWPAYRDVQRTLWGMGSHPRAKELKATSCDKIVSFVHSFGGIRSQEEFDQQHQVWCEDLVAFFAENSHPERPTFQFHYGHAQKWLNMTLKYLSVLGHPAVEEVYVFLHAPIDRDVYERAWEILGVERPRIAWSKLDGDTYRSYQLNIRHAVAGQGRGFVLDWETDEWMEAKRFSRHSLSEGHS